MVYKALCIMQNTILSSDLFFKDIKSLRLLKTKIFIDKFLLSMVVK